MTTKIEDMGYFQICFISFLIIISLPLFLLLLGASNFKYAFGRYSEMANLIVLDFFVFENHDEVARKIKDQYPGS